MPDARVDREAPDAADAPGGAGPDQTDRGAPDPAAAADVDHGSWVPASADEEPRTPGRRPQAQASPLGRYAPDPSGAVLHRVELLRLPLHLVAAGPEHHDGLMRELRLLALSGQITDSAAPARLGQLVAVLGEQYAAARERRDEEVDAALQRGEEWIDQTIDTPATAAVAVRGLMELLDEADVYCEQAALMTLPRSPLLRRFTAWYCGQFVEQIAGEPARPWDGPLRP